MKKLLALFLISLRLMAQSELPTEVLIPGGTFDMGDFLDASPDARPVLGVRLASYWIERDPVTHELWTGVHSWAVTNGYAFNNPGKSKGPRHPVHSVSWHDAVRWCNARSEREGRAPVYFVDSALSQVFRKGEPQIHANWTANGYRLPTEAEWERAARGTLNRKRFPRGDTLGIPDANFYAGATGTNVPAYMGGLTGYNPAYALDGMPYTSPVDAFPQRTGAPGHVRQCLPVVLGLVCRLLPRWRQPQGFGFREPQDHPWRQLVRSVLLLSVGLPKFHEPTVRREHLWVPMCHVRRGPQDPERRHRPLQ